MGGKKRVHELAKELGVTSSDILARLNDWGESAKSASSTVNSPVVRRIREAYETTAAGLARELGLAEKIVLDFARYHGERPRRDDVLPPHLAAQLRQKFRAGGQAKKGAGLGSSASTKPETHAAEDVSPQPPAPSGPVYSYVRELTTNIAHHQDYLGSKNELALCGYQFIEPSEPKLLAQNRTLCEQCAGRLPEYHEKWWHDKFLALDAEFAALRERQRQLEELCRKQQERLASLQQNGSRGGKSPRRKPPPAKAKYIRRVQKSAGAVNSPQTIAAKTAQGQGRPTPRVADPEVVRKRRKEMMAPRPPKTTEEKWADEAAAESMRSHKPSSWRRRYRAK